MRSEKIQVCVREVLCVYMCVFVEKERETEREREILFMLLHGVKREENQTKPKKNVKPKQMLNCIKHFR